jgi:hypothetical protein
LNPVEEFKSLWLLYQQDTTIEAEVVLMMEQLSVEQMLILDKWIEEQNGKVQGSVCSAVG